MVTPATDGERWRPPIEDVLEPVFRRMGVPPMIVAIPDGWSRWGCGQWVDSPVTGNFEQYLLHDVIPAVDAAYRTIPDRPKPGRVRLLVRRLRRLERRVAQPRRPRRAGHALGRLLPGHDAQVHAVQVLRQHLAGGARTARSRGTSGRSSSTTTPRPTRPIPISPPFYVDLPVAWPSGELIQEVWDRWLAFDPVVNVHDRLDNLQHAVRHPPRRGRERRLQPALGSPAAQPPPRRRRDCARAHGEPGQPRRPGKRALPGRAGMAGGRPGRRRPSSPLTTSGSS